jgi:DNA-binding transcriptional LysR family regulator
MELMQLEMFVAVVEEGGFQKAANRIFRTQPAVSLALSKLEQEVGIPLLKREPKRSGGLTPAGEKLFKHATRIIALRDEALSLLKRERIRR